MGLLIEQYGQDGEIARDEFMRYGLHAATSYATTQAGTAGQIADYLEEIFEATGSRGASCSAIRNADRVTSCTASSICWFPSCSGAVGFAPPIPAAPCAKI